MKKMTIGIAIIVFSFISTLGFAATTVATKSDVTIPCYNGGFSFGLAGYTQPLVDQSDLRPSCENNSNEGTIPSVHSEPDYQ